MDNISVEYKSHNFSLENVKKSETGHEELFLKSLTQGKVK
jgi:hypothetical protein